MSYLWTRFCQGWQSSTRLRSCDFSFLWFDFRFGLTFPWVDQGWLFCGVDLDHVDFSFPWATKCHICERDFVKGVKVVRDHDHVTSAHKVYNINYRLIEKIPVIFQNLRGSASQFIMEIGILVLFQIMWKNMWQIICGKYIQIIW